MLRKFQKKKIKTVKKKGSVTKVLYHNYLNEFVYIYEKF